MDGDKFILFVLSIISTSVHGLSREEKEGIRLINSDPWALLKLYERELANKKNKLCKDITEGAPELMGRRYHIEPGEIIKSDEGFELNIDDTVPIKIYSFLQCNVRMENNDTLKLFFIVMPNPDVRDYFRIFELNIFLNSKSYILEHALTIKNLYNAYTRNWTEMAEYYENNEGKSERHHEICKKLTDSNNTVKYGKVKFGGLRKLILNEFKWVSLPGILECHIKRSNIKEYYVKLDYMMRTCWVRVYPLDNKTDPETFLFDKYVSETI